MIPRVIASSHMSSPTSDPPFSPNFHKMKIFHDILDSFRDSSANFRSAILSLRRRSFRLFSLESIRSEISRCIRAPSICETFSRDTMRHHRSAEMFERCQTNSLYVPFFLFLFSLSGNRFDSDIFEAGIKADFSFPFFFLTCEPLIPRF